jgi:hypothetical protein
MQKEILSRETQNVGQEGKTSDEEKKNYRAPNLDTANEQLLEKYCEEYKLSKESVMGWVQKTDEQLEDLKTIVNASDKVIHDMMGPSKAFLLRACERVALMIYVGLQDNKVMIDPTRLPPGKITGQYGQALANEPWFGKEGKTWQRSGHKVPNEENTTLGELLSEGQDGVCLDLKVSREDNDWYTLPKDVSVNFEQVVKFIQLANVLPMPEPIARMIPEELLRDTSPVSALLARATWPKTKPSQ